MSNRETHKTGVDLPQVKLFINTILKGNFNDDTFLNLTKIWDYKGKVEQESKLSPFAFIDNFKGLNTRLQSLTFPEDLSAPVPSFHLLLNGTNELKEKVKKSDIKCIRWLFVDLDVEVTNEVSLRFAQTFQPTMVIRSSPNKYHFYFEIEDLFLGVDKEADMQTVADWEYAMKVLATGFCIESDYPASAADVSSCTPGRMMRIPGIPRVKQGEYFTPEMLVHVERPAIKFRNYKDLYNIFGKRTIDAWASAYEVERIKTKMQNKQLDARISNYKTLSIEAGVEVATPVIANIYHGREKGQGGREPSLYQFLCKVVVEELCLDIDRLLEIAIEADKKNEPPLYVGNGGSEFELDDMENRVERALGYKAWLESDQGVKFKEERKSVIKKQVVEEKKTEAVNLLSANPVSVEQVEKISLESKKKTSAPSTAPGVNNEDYSVGSSLEIPSNLQGNSNANIYEGLSKAQIKELNDRLQAEGLDLLSVYFEGLAVDWAASGAFASDSRYDRLLKLLNRPLNTIQRRLGFTWPMVEGLSSVLLKLDSNKKANVLEASDLFLQNLQKNGFWNESGIVLPCWKESELGNRQVCFQYKIESFDAYTALVCDFLMGFVKRVEKVLEELGVELPYGFSIGYEVSQNLAKMVGVRIGAYRDSLGGENAPYQDPNIIVFQNGVFNLMNKSGSEFVADPLAPALHPYALAVDYIPSTRETKIDYSKETGNAVVFTDDRYSGSAPMFESGVENFSEDPITKQILKLIPAWVAGTNGEAKSFILLNGPSDTGKSAYASLLGYGLGEDRMSNVPMKTLLKSDYLGGFITGSRLMFVGEVSADSFGGSSVTFSSGKNAGRSLGGGNHSPIVIDLIKTLSGNEKIKLDVKFGQPLKIKQAPKLIFATNEDFTPGGSGSDWTSIERRLVPLTFHRIPKEKIVDGWADKIALSGDELDRAFSLSARLVGQLVRGELEGFEEVTYTTMFHNLKNRSEVIRNRLDVLEDAADPLKKIIKELFEFASNEDQFKSSEFTISTPDVCRIIPIGAEDLDILQSFSDTLIGKKMLECLAEAFPTRDSSELKVRSRNFRYYKGVKVKEAYLYILDHSTYSTQSTLGSLPNGNPNGNPNGLQSEHSTNPNRAQSAQSEHSTKPAGKLVGSRIYPKGAELVLPDLRKKSSFTI